jgi:hypothetical protein
MLTVLLYAVLAWFLYNLVFKFILPIYHTTREVKKKFREMNSKMQERAQPQPEFNGHSRSDRPETSSRPKGDYIDFEEIK